MHDKCKVFGKGKRLRICVHKKYIEKDVYVVLRTFNAFRRAFSEYIARNIEKYLADSCRFGKIICY